MCLYEYDEEKQREFDREEGKQELLREQVQKNLEKGYSKEMIADFLGIDDGSIFLDNAFLLQRLNSGLYRDP